MASLPDLVTRLVANTSNFQKGMTGAQNTLTKFAATAAAASSVVVAFSVKSFIAFDDAMRATAATTGATGADLEMLTDTAKRLGATTTFTAVEVGNLMTELGRAGFDPSAINEMTGAVLNLSRATGTDAAQAAGIMGATIRQFNLGAEDATHVADILTHTANSTFNTVEQLGEAMKFAGPAAQDLGVSLEDTAAAVGMLGNIGIQGTMAGTAIRRLAVKTGAEAKKMEEAFGFAFTNAAGEARPLLDNLEDLGKSLERMTGPERMAALSDAFGILGVTGASALGRSAKGAKELSAELKALTGAAKKAADMMDAGAGGSAARALSAFSALATSIGEQLAPAFIIVAESASWLLNSLEQYAFILAPMAAAIAVVSIAWLAYITATKLVIPAMVKVWALMGPKGWAVLAGAGIAIAAATWAMGESSTAASDMAAAQAEVTAAQNKATASAEKFKAGQAAATAELKKTTDAADKFETALRELETPAAKVGREIEEFTAILVAAQTGIVWDGHPLVKAMRQKKTGFTDTMTGLTNELRVLRGEATETGIKLQEFLDAKVDPKKVAELKALFAEKEKFQADADAKKKAVAEAEKIAKAQADAKEFWQAKEDRERLKKPEKPDTPRKREQQFAGIMQKGSAEAFSTIVRSMKTGTGSPEVKATNKVEKAINRQTKIAQAGFDKLTKDKAREQAAI